MNVPPSSRRRWSSLTRRRVATLLLLPLLSQVFVPAAVGRSGHAVAFVELIVPASRNLGQVARIFRQNRKISGQDVAANGLEPGDRLFVTDADAVIFVRYFATNRLAIVHRSAETSKGAPDLTIIAPQIEPPPSLLSRLLADAMRIASGKRTNSMVEPNPDSDNYVIAATRSAATAPIDTICPNASGKTDEPVRFRTATLNLFENRLAAGSRALLIQWRGGIEPYSVILSDAKRKAITELHDLRGSCVTTLPAAALTNGSMVTLTLEDGNNKRVLIPQIEIVADLPTMPKALAIAKLPLAARTLYYATWLTTQDDGIWTFEAVQMVNELGCSTPVAVEWLARYGTTPCIKTIPSAGSKN